MNSIRVLLSIMCAVSGTAAHGQLLSERAEGMQRVCVYRGTASPISGGPTRELRVGLGNNCPVQPPDTAGLPMPATARLQREETINQSRQCVYEQAGLTWARTLSIALYCPLSAGMLPPEQPERRR